jgi:hypothetical protein
MKELFYPSDTIDPTAIPIILDEDKDGVVNVCFLHIHQLKPSRVRTVSYSVKANEPLIAISFNVCYAIDKPE